MTAQDEREICKVCCELLAFWALVALMVAAIVLLCLVMPGGARAQEPERAVYPHLVNCQRCRITTLRDTGNSTSGGGRIVSQTARCRCDVEFRVDSIPPAPAVPCVLP
jgi:hypothetical protein